MDNTKDIIACIVGQSGSGKTTVAELLSKHYNYMPSYTTRKQRYPNEGGHIYVNKDDYLFTKNDKGITTVLRYYRTDKEFGKMYKSVNNIAYTFFDGEHYWAQEDQYQNKGISIYVVDPDGIRELKQLVKDTNIIVLYLEASEHIRVQRMQERKDKEIEKRLANDKIKFAKIDYDFIVNAEQNIEKVYKDVLDLINIYKNVLSNTNKLK